MEKLYLSHTDKKIAGVFGGLADRFHVDSTVLRVAWMVIPDQPRSESVQGSTSQKKEEPIIEIVPEKDTE